MVKCAICNGEWSVSWTTIWRHPENGCVLQNVEVTNPAGIISINKAVEVPKDCPTCPKCGGPVWSELDKAKRKGYRPGFHCRIVAVRSGQLRKCWRLEEGGEYGTCDTEAPVCPVFKVWDEKEKEARKKKK